MKALIAIAVLISFLQAQSYYVLTGVKEYDTHVASKSKQVTKETKAYLEGLLKESSKEIGVDTSKKISRVLAFMVADCSVGLRSGLKIELSLREQVRRVDDTREVFGLTYTDIAVLELSDDKEELQESIEDAADEMLNSFTSQYKEDNDHTDQKNSVMTHKDFAKSLAYETNYSKAHQKAKKLNKPLLVFMSKTFCPWCRKFENRVLANEYINKQIHSKYVPVVVDYHEKNYPKALEKITLSPVLYVLDEKSEKIVKHFVGYKSKDAFLHYLKN